MQQDSLFSSDSSQQVQIAGPVTCLGKIFPNDQERREYFLALLAEKLKDPEFRKIEGFPIGDDVDILNLSDPPYYTACPNPWIVDFVEEWEAQKLEFSEEYHREPFSADVSEGKNDPIYNAHSYHTKVPHKAIMRYILHYTNPGDIVFDGFCGSGMTGIAAQMCGDKEMVMSLGYQVKPDGTILQGEKDLLGNTVYRPFSKLGQRKVILNDLSPAATYIAYNYNTSFDLNNIENEARKILREVELECGWMYETLHTDEKTKGKINYTIWSDIFICPECNEEIVFWNTAVNKESGQVSDTFPCPHCHSELTKRNMDRAWSQVFDKALKRTIKQAKQIPVLINYSIDGKRYEKLASKSDIDLINRIDDLEIPYRFPIDELPDGFNTRQPMASHGITNVHHFYTKRNLWTLSSFFDKACSSIYKRYLIQFVVGSLKILSKQAKHNKERRVENSGLGWVNAGVAGTLYISSCPAEQSPLFYFQKKCSKLFSLKNNSQERCISSSSTTEMPLKNSCLDYIFLDPPFGANLNYSELSFGVESWIRLRTNNENEAIENSYQGKDLYEYRRLMTKCFKEAYRLLKPGKWMTVEFSNTKASVWNTIQTALSDAGFIIADVSALDKKIGTFKAVTTPTAVKQDLVLSAYKPNTEFETMFQIKSSTEGGVWEFISTHLQYLPVIKQHGGQIISIHERDPRILFDQVIAYYVRKAQPVPISSQAFQTGLNQRYTLRDGMFFLPEQAAEYDKRKVSSGVLMQTSLFVKDEASAIDWLRQQLKYKPQTFSDINPQFMQQLGGWSKNEVVLDLRELLSQNFLCYDGQDDVPDQIHSYLSSNWKELRNLSKDNPALVIKAKDRWYVPDPNKAGDLEKLREKSLLKEFEEYKAAKKKLKIFRIEAVRVGFKNLWEQQEFATLIAIADKLPNNVLEEDPVLLMYYDQAVTLSQIDTDDEW